MRIPRSRARRLADLPRPLGRLTLVARFLLLPAAAGADAGTPSLEACRAAVARSPAALASYECYWRLARREPTAPASAALLGILAREPDRLPALLYLARIEGDRGENDAERHYRAAIVGFAAAGEASGETRARLGLALFLGRRGRFDEADAEIAAAEAAARTTGDRALELAVACERGWQDFRRGSFAAAAERFDAAWAEVASSPDLALRAYCLSGMGGAAMETGRFEAAAELTRRQAEICRELGDRYDEARARGNLVLAAFRLAQSGSMTTDQVRAHAEAALAAARAGGNRGSEARAELYLGDLTVGEEARAHYRAGLEISRETREVAGLVLGHRGLALHAVESGTGAPEAAFAQIETALELARGSRFYTAVARLARARMRWLVGPRPSAVRDSLDALAAIEEIRDLQNDDLARARVFGIWAFAYHRLAGELLAAPDPSEADLDLAFEVSERLRARALLDELDAARASASLVPRGELAERRESLLAELAQAEKSLLQVDLPPAERSARSARLDALKRAELRAREALYANHPSWSELRRPRVAALAEVRRALEPDQLLVAFQVTNRFNVDNRTTERGSWAWAISRDRVAVAPVPDAAELRGAVSLFLGLIERRDGAERDAAAELYRSLLAGVLAEVPPGVTRVIVVPDGPLHRLPFGALRETPEAPALIERFELVTVPSASVWLRVRDAAYVARTFLALSDPRPAAEAGSEAGAADRRAVRDPLTRPLPGARNEAAVLARVLGGRGERWSGAEASEARLKSTVLTRFGILHFGVHAVVDDEAAERSAIVLAADPDGEDDHLRLSEIVGLELGAPIVVLAACRTASGTVIEGEGVVSLARGFFLAGARAVVASLTPVRDDEAARLLSSLYSELARGRSVAASLAAAERRLLRAGRPASAWSAFVVLGDGDARLARQPGAGGGSWLAWILAAALAASAGGLVWLARRRFGPGRRRPPPPRGSAFP